MKAQPLNTLLILALSLPLSPATAADLEGDLAPALQPKTESILLPVPGSFDLYERSYRSLAGKSRWKIRMHGLRNAPLHPATWGMRREHRTLSRNLVAMRPFYLRASEDPEFSIQSISTRFNFEAVTEEQINGSPERFTPLLDIGFAGTFAPLEGDISADRTYYVRLSGSTRFPSGLYFRNHDSSTLIEELPPVSSGSPVNVTLEFKDRSVSVGLNDHTARTFELGQSTEKGYVYLHTDWHPLSMDKLVVSGTKNSQPVTFSGLIILPSGKIEKSGED